MIKASIYDFLGRIFIPDSIDLEAPYLLHISDTPSSIFGALESFIKRVNPKIIVHTGDLVDNLKLELYPSVFEGYKHYLKRLVRILEGGERQVYYAMGNHDDYETLKAYSIKGHIVSYYEVIQTSHFSFGMAHDINSVSTTSPSPDMIFFGHNLEKASDYEHVPKYFNGIEKMALIHIVTGEIYTFDYPIGTKESRLNMYRKKL
ncbi:MAG: metallophosphoesterase [Clostridia bacterium]|nr:metallophosphoesterase [Clostridia bacterium]